MGDVEYKKLGDIFDCIAGATPSTSKRENWDNGTIPWMSSGEINHKEIYNTEKFITETGYRNSSTKMVPADTVLIALAGQGKTRGKVAVTHIPLCTNQSLCSLVKKESVTVNSRFVFYVLDSKYQELRQISTGDGTRGGLNLEIIGKYEIIFPSIEVQDEIVDILDQFYSLCNDITIGLPAEIEARQKQYEYYRDKLLSFQEK